MKILFASEVIFLIILIIIGKTCCNMEDVKEEVASSRIRFLLPAGFQLLKLFRHRYRSGYEMRLEAKLRELGSSSKAHAMLKVYIAQKTVYIIVSVIFITFIGTQVQPDTGYFLFAVLFPAMLFYLMDKQIDSKISERRNSIRIEFSEFLNKLVLLVNAGMTVSGAIRKIVKDSRKKTPLYMELAATINDMDSGKPEIQSYEDFAKRCRLQEVSMFTAVLLQNLRKGNDELVPVLRVQANACWENRKNAARKLGEEAATKLVIPMIIMFVAIIIMVMTPAVMQINI